MAAEMQRQTLDAMGPQDRADFFRRALAALDLAGIPYMIGGAYALERYTGITRDTKDIDVFVRPADSGRTLAAWSNEGFGIELTDPNWLAKAYEDDYFLDLIFNSGNGMCPVDEEWFAHAVDDTVVGMPVKLCPLEEMVWQKVYIMERERYDGADVAHLIRDFGPRLDWQRLLARIGDNWEVLLAHLILVNYVFPDDGEIIPQTVMDELLDRQRSQPERQKQEPRACRGTLISRYQYLRDIYELEYRDPRPSAVRRDAADARPELH
jgi:hypothetical protein